MTTPRALPEPLAAIHCGFVTKDGKPQIERFRATCPVAKLPLSGRTAVYDVVLLDRWIDDLSGIEHSRSPQGNAYDQGKAAGAAG